MNKRIETQYNRNFDTLLFDSLNMLLHSLDDDTDYDFRQTLARSAIVNSILMLELAANVCIETLELERSVFNDIDKLSVLAKFDFFLRTSFADQKIDRGVKEIQAVNELKKLRDGYVHMKPHKIEMEFTSDDEAIGEFEKTDLLKIPKNPQGWCQESAISAMSAVHAFLKYFFIEKCNFTDEKVSSLLFSEEKVPTDNNCIMPLFHKATVEEFLGLGIDLSYLKLSYI